MQINLRYEGCVPGQGRSIGRLQRIWDMRLHFHRQLKHFWGKPPFGELQKWEDSGFAAGAPQFITTDRSTTYVPFYSLKVGAGVKVEFTLLLDREAATRHKENRPDVDNAIKSITDALRIPQGKQEHIEKLKLPGRIYCLMSDDDVMVEYTIRRGYHSSTRSDGANLVLVRVTPYPIRVTTDNLEMLM